MMDKSKAILDKLKSKSRKTGVGFQQLLLLMCQEEFLRRLSKSKHKDKFVLKGGLFIYILSNFESRGTVDMDFLLVNQSNDITAVVKEVEGILDIQTENNFIKYEIIDAKGITVEKKYPGVSIHMLGKIGNTKTPVNIDFGIGDIIVPKSEMRVMRPQLEEFQNVEVVTYSLESSVAEKIDAILQRFELTSRMKDFFDLWYISKNFDFDGSVLSLAVKNTLLNRGTIMESDSIDRIMRLPENQMVITRWMTYVKKMRINLELEECINIIGKLMSPVFDSILIDEVYKGRWISVESAWVKD